MTRRRVAALLPVLVLLTTAGCGDDEERLEPAAFSGDWDVSLVVGSVDADPGADPATFPGSTTFRERWVFEGCDETNCTLRRPEGGLLLGDLDGLILAVTAGGLEGDEERFVGEGEAGAVPRGGEHPVVEGEEAGHAEEDPCVGSPAQQWRVRVEVAVSDDVLSGTVIRTPESLRVQVGEVTCFGLDLTMGFSGVPGATEAPTGDG